MQRLNWKRMAVVVGAVCAVGGAANGDALAAIVTGQDIEDVGLQPDQIRLNLDLIGVYAGMQSPVSASQFYDYADVPFSCDFDGATQQRVCRARRTPDDISAAIAFRFRSRTGDVQKVFDAATTDTVFVRTGNLVDRMHPRGGPYDSRAFRSTRLYTGVSEASPTRVLDGVDSTFRTYSFASGRIVRLSKYVTYSNVVTAKPTAGKTAFPIAGILHAVSESRAADDSAHTLFGLNVIIYFDGTSTPEAYIGGQRYTIDLTSGIATPKVVD